MTRINNEIKIADWFAQKNDIDMGLFGADVYAILKETEKAIYAIVGNMFGRVKTTWIPKSVLSYKEASSSTFCIAGCEWKEAMELIRSEARMWA